MNQDSLAIVITVALVAIGGGAAIYWLSQQNTGMANMNMGQHAGASNDPSEAVATDSVTIKGFSFSPRTISVKVGTTVAWTNQDGVRHSVVADNGDGSDGPLLGKGESYHYTFKRSGTFTYHCGPHPDMKGTVIVTD